MKLTTDVFVNIIAIYVFVKMRYCKVLWYWEFWHIYGNAKFGIFWLLYQDSSVLLFIGLT